MKDLILDIRYSIRTFGQSPAFTLVVVMSLALGIGANTSMYSAVDAMFLRELDVRHPDELVVFGWQSGPGSTPFGPRSGGVFSTNSHGSGENRVTTRTGARFSKDIIERFRADGQSLSAIAAFSAADIDATIDGSSEEITAQLVSGDYFETVGVRAVAGRTIGTSDDLASASATVVISHGFWKRRFNLDPSAVGKPVVLNGVLPATIVGVTPESFHIGRGTMPDLSIPLAFEPQLASGLLAPENWGLQVVARMKPGISSTQVRDNLQGVFQGMAVQEAPNTQQVDLPRLYILSAAQGFTTDIVSDAMGRGDSSRYGVLVVITGICLVLLLIVGLNVANLMIARAATRQYEFGVRTAMGASRRRLIRQLLTESVMLSVVGGAVGAVFAVVGKDLLRVFLVQDTRTVMDLKIDWQVLFFSAAMSLMTGILFGIAPALRATRTEVNSAVKQGSRTVRGSRSGIGRGLVVLQVAMSVVLLVGAGLLLRTVGNFPDSDIGFNAENLLVFQVNSRILGDNRVVYDQVTESIRRLPGVLAMTTSSNPLLGSGGSFTGGRFSPTGDDQSLVRTDTIRLQTVHAGFFDVIGIPLVRGRGFSASDNRGARKVVVITESLAQHLKGDPLGWRLFMQTGESDETTYWQIVGVVKNIGVSEIGLRTHLDGTVFFPESQQDSFLSTFEVRTAGSPLLLTPAIREILRKINPNLRASAVSTEMDLVRRKLESTRYIAATWVAFGGVALVLTSIGLYGLLSHSVARRVNEIGIRMALGARRLQVVRLVMSQIVILVAIGLILGTGLSLLVNLLIQPLVYGVTFNDPVTFVIAAVVMLAVTGASGYLPARRATLVDPMIALRHE